MFRHEDYATEKTSHGVYERQQNKAECPSDACYRAGVTEPFEKSSRQRLGQF